MNRFLLGAGKDFSTFLLKNGWRLENEQINLFEHKKKHAKAELNEHGCQIPTKRGLRFHQGHHFEINRGDSLNPF